MCMLHPNTVASKTVWGGITIMIANRGLKIKFRPLQTQFNPVHCLRHDEQAVPTGRAGEGLRNRRCYCISDSLGIPPTRR